MKINKKSAMSMEVVIKIVLGIALLAVFAGFLYWAASYFKGVSF
tara:strand:- start:211 stop:342 length:132 start_codon:yes stop_codon:yes gene_type:complete